MAARWGISLTAEPTPSGSKEDAQEEVRPAEEEGTVAATVGEEEEVVPERRKTRGRKRKAEDEEVQVGDEVGQSRSHRNLRQKIKF